MPPAAVAVVAVKGTCRATHELMQMIAVVKKGGVSRSRMAGGGRRERG